MSDITDMRKIIFLLLFCLSSFFLYSEEKSRREIVSGLFSSIEEWFGVPYVLGGNTKTGIDCSGFVVNVYKKVFNKTLPRTVAYQKSVGVPVKGKLQPGDLVFFNIHGNRVSHVGIYVFDGKFIHAASAGPEVGVIKSSLNESYYKRRYVYARRIVDLPPYRKEDYQDAEKTEKKEQQEKLEKKEKQDRKDPEKKIDPQEEEISVRTGSSLLDGKIGRSKGEFKNDTPFYIQVDNNTTKAGIITIEVAYQGNRVYDESVVTVDAGANHVETVVVEKGTYVLNVYKESGILIFKKLIRVE